MDIGVNGTDEPMAPLCALQYAASRIERCPGARCPFWVEPGGEEGRCAVAVAGIDLDRPGIVPALLKLRRVLDRRGRDAEARSLFYLLEGERPPKPRP